MNRTRILCILAVGAAVFPVPGAAQTCDQLPIAETCEARGVSLIDRRVPGIGGDVVCQSGATNPGKVQYDTYVVQFSYLFYSCSRYRTCLWTRTNDSEAWQAFCK